MKTIEFKFEEAAKVIEEKGWIQGAMESEKGVCLTGALKYCEPQPGDRRIIREVLAYRKRAEEWNDAEHRLKSQVLQYLREAPDITDEELERVFGPQWRQIVALVRRTAVLTPDEIDRLCAARDTAVIAARDAAVFTARTSTREAAWNTARISAWSSAWNAARSLAWSAAWDAVSALCVRDLIGQRGFTQEHYDVLTTPWRTVIGKLHEDDEATK